jgi:hypothetical protein
VGDRIRRSSLAGGRACPRRIERGAPPGPGAPPQPPAAAAAGAGEILAGVWCARKGDRPARDAVATGEQGVSGQGVRRFGGF